MFMYVYVMYIHIMCSSELLKSVHWHAVQVYHRMSYPYFVLFTLHKAQEAGIILTGS